MGSRHRQNAPYQRFETQDGYMMIGAAAQSIWERCARALGHPEWLEDARFARSPERRKNRFALEKEITAVLATAPTAHWTKLLDEAGVPCGPVYNYEQLFSDPQVRHREMVVHAEDAELGGRVPHIRTPIRMSAADVAVRRTAPKLGQHTDEVLGRLGYSAAEVAVLRREKVV
jgi:crotonobetainyl-CoA:carnitine CoA-transferase CaiB-like acyl-CoA transferase